MIFELPKQKEDMKREQLTTRGMIYASMFGALTAIGALISIPLQPVPVTLQTLFLYLAGSLLGGRVGALSQIIYVILGVIGLPVFSGGKAGLGVFLGPTGGYLLGFIAGAFVTGKIVEAREKPCWRARPLSTRWAFSNSSCSENCPSRRPSPWGCCPFCRAMRSKSPPPR
jgi:biotin transporter BioY